MATWPIEPAASDEPQSRRYLATNAKDERGSPSGLFFIDRSLDIEEPVPVGTLFAPDDYTLLEGDFGYPDGGVPDFSYMRPYGTPAVPPPVGSGYKPGVLLQVMFEEWGLWQAATNADCCVRAWKRLFREIRRQRPRAGQLAICQLMAKRSILTSFRSTIFATESELTGRWLDRLEEKFGPILGDPAEMVGADNPLARLRAATAPPITADDQFARAHTTGERRVPRAIIRETAPATSVRAKYDPKLDDPKPKDPARPQFDPNLDDELP